MFSKVLTLLVLTVLPVFSFAQTADIGDVIVVRGTVEDCVQWPDRVLDVQLLEDNNPVTLLEAIEVEAVGAGSEEILSVILDVIEKYTGKRPDSLWIEVLPSEMYETIASEYIYSENYLLDGKCPSTPRPPIPEVRPIDVPSLLKELDRKHRERDRKQRQQDQRLEQEWKLEQHRLLELFDRTG